MQCQRHARTEQQHALITGRGTQKRTAENFTQPPVWVMGPLGGKKRKKTKNQGVGVDFKKVKHKARPGRGPLWACAVARWHLTLAWLQVGKRLPKAQNETNTDFKARSINLPNQAVKEDKAGATNHHNLTLKVLLIPGLLLCRSASACGLPAAPAQELLAQAAHYNDKMRKAALAGLADLFTRHPHELKAHVGLVYSRCCTVPSTSCRVHCTANRCAGGVRAQAGGAHGRRGAGCAHSPAGPAAGAGEAHSGTPERPQLPAAPLVAPLCPTKPVGQEPHRACGMACSGIRSAPHSWVKYLVWVKYPVWANYPV